MSENNKNKKNISPVGIVFTILGAIFCGESVHKVSEATQRKNAMNAAMRENNRDK